MLNYDGTKGTHDMKSILLSVWMKSSSNSSNRHSVIIVKKYFYKFQLKCNNWYDFCHIDYENKSQYTYIKNIIKSLDFLIKILSNSPLGSEADTVSKEKSCP